MCIDCENSLNIPQGPVGPQGPIGETGPAGPQGEQGPQGDPGTGFDLIDAVTWPTDQAFGGTFTGSLAGFPVDGIYRIYVEVNILAGGTPLVFNFGLKNNGVLLPGTLRYGSIAANTAVTYVVTYEGTILFNPQNVVWFATGISGSGGTIKAGYCTKIRLA